MAGKKKAKKKTARSAAVKKAAKKRPSRKKATRRRNPAGKKPVAKKRKQPRRRERQREQVENRDFSGSAGDAAYGVQSGDLQGISTRHGADSESVDELLEEGNTFEAGVITGVEKAGDDEPKEVRTRQVPEDDVPSEYLDEE